MNISSHKFKKCIAVLLTAISFLANSLTATCETAAGETEQLSSITADACVVMEGKTGAVLYEKNKDKDQ